MSVVPPGRLAVVTMLDETRRNRIILSERLARRLWLLAALDISAVAWLAVGSVWVDAPAGLFGVVTLGGHSRLVLAAAIGAFLLLVGLAVATHGFAGATRFQVGLIVLACTASVVALAGALSTILLLFTAALALGFVLRPLFRR